MSSTARRKHGATFLLNAPYGPDEVWDHLPGGVQQLLLDKEIDFWVIDALAVADEAGMGSRINTVMQPCFFQLAGIMPADEAITRIKGFVETTYAMALVAPAEPVKRSETRLRLAAGPAVEAFVVLGSARPFGRTAAAGPGVSRRCVALGSLRRFGFIPACARLFRSSLGFRCGFVLPMRRPARVCRVAPRPLTSAVELAATGIRIRRAHRCVREFMVAFSFGDHSSASPARVQFGRTRVSCRYGAVGQCRVALVPMGGSLLRPRHDHAAGQCLTLC